jgi:hypothetical protein
MGVSEEEKLGFNGLELLGGKDEVEGGLYRN